jgi:DNA polymerase-3 subunit delta
LNQLESHLKQKGLPALLILEGEEEHLVSEALKKIRGNVHGEMECFTLYGDQVDSEEFHNDLNTLSFFGSSKVYIIKSAQSLPKASLESLNEIFKTQPQGLHVALFINKLDKRKKVYKELLSNATLFELKPPYENQMSQWVRALAKDKGLSLTTDQIELIRHLVGDALTDISEALDRLKDNYGTTPLTDEKIQKAVSLKRRSDLFKICDLMGLADFTGASLEIDRALKEGESPVALINLLLRHFDILMKIKNENSRASKYDLAKVVGVPAFFIPNYKEQSDLWGKEELSFMQDLIEEFEIMSKSASIKADSLTSALLIKSTAIFGKKKRFVSL